MTTTRKPTTPLPPTEAEARNAMADYAQAYLAIEQIETTQKADIERIKKSAADDVKPLQEKLLAAERIVHGFVDAHPELITPDKRTIEIFGGHRAGYRLSQPATALIKPANAKKKQTWDGFVAACKLAAKSALGFIRHVSYDEPNKEAVLTYYAEAKEAARKAGNNAPIDAVRAELAALGVEVKQEDAFVIELSLPKAAAT